MKTKEEAAKHCNRCSITNFDIGEHLQEEFNKLIESKKYYLYSKDIKDKDIDYIVTSEYGDFRNKMWNVIEDRKHNKTYYGFMDCMLAWPQMEDRKGFIDILDRQISNDLYEIMIEMYKDEIEYGP